MPPPEKNPPESAPAARQRTTGLWLPILFIVTAGCSGIIPGSGIDGQIEDARRDLRDSKKDYEYCLHDQEDEPELVCEGFKNVYEEDRDQYDRLLALKKAGRR